MTLKLAFKNVIKKPWRSVATVIVVAIAVSLIFCMMSFGQAVYDYIFAVETADSGRADVLISTNSTSPKITSANGLEVDGVTAVVPTLSIYALFNAQNGDEYVKLRGFEKGQAQILNDVRVIEGDLNDLDKNTDNIVISKSMADAYGLRIGAGIDVVSGVKSKTFYVVAIAQNTGYFLASQPETLLCSVKGVSSLIFGEYSVYNEIYLQTDGNVDEIINAVLSMPDYSAMTVERAEDVDYVSTQASSLSAPIVIAGLGVVVLAIACIVLLSLSSLAERRNYISKLSGVGATKTQILNVFIAESLILAGVGVLVGTLLSSGVFVLLVRLILSSTIAFSVSALKLFGSAVIGFLCAVSSVALPIILALRRSVRENEQNSPSVGRVGFILRIALLALTTLCLILEFTVAKGVLSIINVLLVLLTVTVFVPYLTKGCTRPFCSCKRADVKLVAVSVARSRHSRSLQTLTAGMTVVMLLFMAWSVTTDVFSGYLNEFEDKVFVTNVPSSVADSADVDGISNVDGVKNAIPMVWQQATVNVGKDKTINVLGSADAIGLVDFEFITPKDEVIAKLNQEGIVVLDKAYCELFGIRVGDKVSFELNGKRADLTVGGLTRHKLFSGNYAVLSLDTLKTRFGVGADTVVVVVDDGANARTVAERIRANYATKNYYSIEALTLYKWDAQSMSRVFDLVGTLAVIVAVLVFLVLVFYALSSRSAGEKARTAMLDAGVSKSRLLGIELGEQTYNGIVAYLVSFATSALVTASLIGALRLFDLYFEFTYTAWIVAVVGGVFAVGYGLLPLILAYRRKYKLGRL